MKTLLLITNGFPYGTSEQSFIRTEYNKMANAFDVHIVARNAQTHNIQKEYENEEVARYDDKTNKWLLLKMMLNKDVIKELSKVLSKSMPFRNRFGAMREIATYANLSYAIKPFIKEEIEKHNIDVVYTYWCTHATLAAIWLKKEFPDLLVVSRFHGYDLYNERTTYDWQPFRSLISVKLDSLVFASTYGRDYFADKWNRVGTVHYLGTKKRSMVEENPDEFVIVSCSNLIALKRVDLIIAALAEIPKEIRIKWIHFGEGNQRANLEKQAEYYLKSKRNVEYLFAGFIENEALIAEYQKIKPWLFITTSSSEGGAPVSIQEALSLGIPCIGTKAGGITETIEDRFNGFLIDSPADSKELATKIEYYYNLTDSQRKQYRKNAYDMWQRLFDGEENAKAFVDEIVKLAN